MRKANGFTIVEILIVVGIIGILSTIGFIGFSKYQADTRDSEREAKASILIEALEKYYDANGEYPSCEDITGDPVVVTKEVLPGVEQQTLQAPQRPGGEVNSIKCIDLTESTSADFFAYVGDNASTCTGAGGAACVLYQLKYKEESTGEIVTMNSRRKTGLSSTDVPNLTLSTISFTQIDASWSAVSGATSYTLQRATDSGFTTNVSTTPGISGTSQSATGLNYGTTYFFRIRATSIAGDGAWSPATSAPTRSLTQPTCSATANSPSQITVSWNAITYASTYTVEYDDNSGFSSPTTSTGNTTTSKAITGLGPGSTLYMRVRAVNGAYLGNWCSTVNATTIVPVPSGVTLTANSTVQVTASWSAVTSATSYQIDHSTSSVFSSFTTTTSATTSEVIAGLDQNTTYYVRVRSVIGSYVSPNSATASAATPVVVLSGPVECAGAYSGRPTYQLRLWLQEVSYNLAANQSNVNWQLYRYSTSSTYHSYDQTRVWPWSVSINGSGWGGNSNSIAFKVGGAGTTELIASASLAVQHDANGNATIGYAGSDGPGSTIFGSASCSSAYALGDLR